MKYLSCQSDLTGSKSEEDDTGETDYSAFFCMVLNVLHIKSESGLILIIQVIIYTHLRNSPNIAISAKQMQIEKTNSEGIKVYTCLSISANTGESQMS